MMIQFECGCLLVRKALALCAWHRDNLERLVMSRHRANSPWGPWQAKKYFGPSKGAGVSSKTAGR